MTESTKYDAAAIFRGTARYYARFRPGYGEALFDRLVTSFRLREGSMVVDIGCGTGQVSIPLARRGMSVVGVDPEPEMLVEARANAEVAGVAGRIAFHEVRAEDFLETARVPVQLVVFGSSLHWTHREQVLALCDRLVTRDGGVAVISSAARQQEDGSGGAPYSRVVMQTIQEFLGPRRRVGGGFYAEPQEGHERLLRRSAFCRIEVWRGLQEIVRTADELIGLQFSSSYCSPVLLGSRKDKFEKILRGRLLGINPANRFTEIREVEALCAQRP